MNEKDLSEKHRKVVEILREENCSSEELSEKLNVAKTTAKDKIHDLQDIGFEIEYDWSFYEYQLLSEPDGFSLNEYDVTLTVDGPEDAPDSLVNGLKKGMTYEDLRKDFGLSRSESRRVMQEMQESGYNIDTKQLDAGRKMYYIPEDDSKFYRVGNGDGTYEFALISDTHLGSSAEHLEELHDFYDRCQKRGIDTVFHAGDISDGWEVHQGHINVIKGEAAGWGNLKDYVVENYPEREGIDTYFIEGNHDHKYHRRNGIHFGQLISQKRDDLHYLGDSQARLVFDAENDIDLELIHPSGGKPYTAGYRMMTLYREREFENRPTIAGIGHLHGSMYAKVEGVYAFYTGAWKGTTTYGKRKGHESQIGGWILELEIEDGEVRSLVNEWVGYESNNSSNSFAMSELEAMTK